jgi:arginyl-tRNA synthetase
VTYLIELSASFNSFYAEEKIVDSTDVYSPYKLALTEAVRTVLENGLNFLAIPIPKEM